MKNRIVILCEKKSYIGQEWSWGDVIEDNEASWRLACELASKSFSKKFGMSVVVEKSDFIPVKNIVI